MKTNIKIYCDIDGVIIPLNYNSTLTTLNLINNTNIYYNSFIITFINSLNNIYNFSWLSYREEESTLINSIFTYNISYELINNSKWNNIKYAANRFDYVIWLDDEEAPPTNELYSNNIYYYPVSGNTGLTIKDIIQINTIIDNVVLL